jgi:peptide/nickel transport system substrate-binding protein
MASINVDSTATTRQTTAWRQPTSTPHYGGTLRFLGPGGVDHLDTATAYYATSGQILRALTRQLFAYPASGDLSDPLQAFIPAPDIAAEIPSRSNGGLSEDRLTYTIRLRQGVMWDSSPPREVTAHDVIRGLKRLANPVSGAGALHYFTSTIAGMQEYCEKYHAAFVDREPTPAALAEFQQYNDISGLHAADKRTLVVTLRQPANDFLNILAMGFASPAPQEYDAYLPDSAEFRQHMLSNGPYRLATYAAGGKEIVLKRNPAWRQETDPIRHQYVDTIHIRVTGEPPEVVRGKIDSGEIDLAWSYTAVSWARPKPGQDAGPRSYPGFALNPYLVFNMQSPNEGGAVRRLGVRQAIAYAVDKVAISEILDVLDAPNTPLHSAVPPGSVGYREFNLYPTPSDRGNPDKARRLLVEAGYPDGLNLIAAVRNIGMHQEVMRSVAHDLAKIGITLTMNTYSQGEYYGTLLSDPTKGRQGAWDIAEPGWTPDWFGNNGRAILQPLFQTNNSPGTTNYGCYSNPRVDELIKQALQEDDLVRAEGLWYAVNVEVMKDVAIVPLLAFAAMTSRYHSRRVKNAIHVPQIEFFDITNLWLDPVD